MRQQVERLRAQVASADAQQNSLLEKLQLAADDLAEVQGRAQVR